VGPGRRKTQHNHTRPQTKAENNEHHRAPERYSRYEEVVVRVESSIDAEKERQVQVEPLQEKATYDRTVGGGK
jgi:hypothetical protein